MAYEKHEWQTGEVITAEKLNHIEDGIGSGFSSISLTSDKYDQYYFTINSAADTFRGTFTPATDADTGKIAYVVSLYKDGTVDDFDSDSDDDTAEEKEARNVRARKAQGILEYIFKTTSYDDFEANYAALYKAKLGRDYVEDKNNNTISSDPITVFF